MRVSCTIAVFALRNVRVAAETLQHSKFNVTRMGKENGPVCRLGPDLLMGETVPTVLYLAEEQRRTPMPGKGPGAGKGPCFVHNYC